MTDHCAICGEDTVWTTTAIPQAWRAVLESKQGLEEPAGYYLLPACESCAEDVTIQRELDPSADDPAHDPTDDTRALLAKIDVDALIEEHEEDRSPFDS